MSRLAREVRRSALHKLMEGTSQRACERMLGISNNTVAKIFRDAGDAAIDWMASLGDLECNVIQADEIFAYVGAKQKNVARMKRPNPDAGTVWCYLAQDADTKLILDFRLGDRDVHDATEFMKSVSSRLKRDEHGRFAVRPTIVTDGLPAYKEACALAFGEDADVGMLVKQYTKVDENGNKLPSSRYAGANRAVLHGSPNPKLIHTSYIERTNLNLRMYCKRYVRRTNAFSKTMINHKRHVALWALYTNLCRVPKTLRVTPAMAAGISDHIWEVDEILDLTDQFLARRRERELAAENDNEVVEAIREGEPTHWVYRSPMHYLAKVHTAGCSNCRHGAGKGKGSTFGTWHPFFSEEEALAAAATMEPDRYSICNMCLGSYRNNGPRGPRR